MACEALRDAGFARPDSAPLSTPRRLGHFFAPRGAHRVVSNLRLPWEPVLEW